MRSRLGCKYLQSVPSARRGSSKISTITYKVVLHESEAGFAISCPALHGCWSQGADEAIANIRDAIREYLIVLDGRMAERFIYEIKIAK